MSTSCMQAQAIKQQLKDMPLEEFEDLLKGVTAVNKGHEGMPQHAELLSQLKHHVKVPPDEPFPRKSSGDKECPKFLIAVNGNKGNSDGECSNINGSVGGGSANLSFGPHKHTALFGSSSASRFFPGGGDQNANNPLSSTSDTPIPPYSHPAQPPKTSPQFTDYNNHYQNHHHNNLSCGNSLDGDPDDDDDQDVEDHPIEYVGSLPSPYIINSDTKFNKDLQAIFPKQFSSALATCGTSQAAATGSSSSTDSPATSSASWDLQSTASSHLQLNDGYKSVSSVTSGASSYMGRSSNDCVVGTVRSVSPTLPPALTSGMISKSPSLEGSQFDKPTGRRTGDRKKKSSKNVLRETLINPEDMPGYKGKEQDIDKLLEFVEGNQTKTKKPQKEKKRDPKPKGNEKQILSKAASLDENSLGYGSKKGDDMSRNRNSKDIEKKNSTNITKSSTAICSVDIADSNDKITNEPGSAQESTLPKCNNSPTPLVNGTAPAPVMSKSIAAKATPPSSDKSSGMPKSQTVTGKTEKSQSPEVVSSLKSESQDNSEPKGNVSTPIKTDEDKLSKPDESDGPYVLVQSKKKREKKKLQQRESENFARSHVDQARREGGRGRRSNTERRKSVGSVPGSENDECSDDDDSVRSLPAGECTPRERIPKPCSSSGGTPQTSYADIARMSRDETGKAPNSPPISLLPTTTKSPSVAKSPVAAKSPISTAKSPSAPVTVTSDSNFPALSPQNTIEKTAPVGAAVWPCRQRQDQDPMSKEKSPMNSKSDDKPKEDAPPIASTPQLNSANSIPPKCSTKLLFETNETCLQDKTPVEKISLKDMSISSTLSESSSVEPEQVKEPVQIKCNGTVPPGSSCADKEPLTFAAGAKSLGNRKSEDRKSKDRSINVCEEVLAKSNSYKATENGDFVIHSTEPVVFCGGKFDGSSLPVGQKIGFEFGFGVIEALNDSSGLTESSLAEPSSTDFPAISAISVSGTKEKPEQIRSQDRVATVANNPEKKIESQNAKNDQVPRSVEKQSNKTGPIKTNVFQASDSISVDHGASGDSIRQASPKQKTHQQAVGDSKTAASIDEPPQPQPPQSAVPCVSNMEKPAEPTTDVDNPDGKKPADAGIAQIYMPPKQTTVPDSVRQAFDYMDNYAARLTNLSKEGKVSYYRIV